MKKFNHIIKCLVMMFSFVFFASLSTVKVSASETVTAPLDFVTNSETSSGEGYYWDGDKKELSLENFTMNVSEDIQEPSIKLPEDSTITILGVNTITSYTAIETKGDLTLNGTGKITLINQGYSIKPSNDYFDYDDLNITLSSGEWYANNDLKALNFTINGGKFILEDDVIDLDIRIDENLTVNGGVLKVYNNSDAEIVVSISNKLEITNGEVDVKACFDNCFGVSAMEFVMSGGTLKAAGYIPLYSISSPKLTGVAEVNGYTFADSEGAIYMYITSGTTVNEDFSNVASSIEIQPRIISDGNLKISFETDKEHYDYNDTVIVYVYASPITDGITTTLNSISFNISYYASYLSSLKISETTEWSSGATLNNNVLEITSTDIEIASKKKLITLELKNILKSEDGQISEVSISLTNCSANDGAYIPEVSSPIIYLCSLKVDFRQEPEYGYVFEGISSGYAKYGTSQIYEDNEYNTILVPVLNISEGYVLSGWRVYGSDQIYESIGEIVFTEEKTTIYPYLIMQYTINVSAGEGGNISETSIKANQDSNLLEQLNNIAIPEDEYILDKWVIVDDTEERDVTNQDKVTSELSVKAYFKKYLYDLTLELNNSTIVVSSGADVTSGRIAQDSSILFEASASEGYVISSVSYVINGTNKVITSNDLGIYEINKEDIIGDVKLIVNTKKLLVVKTLEQITKENESISNDMYEVSGLLEGDSVSNILLSVNEHKIIVDSITISDSSNNDVTNKYEISYTEGLRHIANGIYHHDEHGHWQKCECGKILFLEEHHGHGDCSHNAICEKCGYEIPNTIDVNNHIDANNDGYCDHCNKSLNPPTQVDNNKLGVGAIIGIVVASLVVVGIGGFTIIYFIVKKKRWSDFITMFKKK